MRDILCMYYSRTGATRQAMTEIAQALDAELVELTDGVDRQGARGYLRSGMDAMRRATLPLAPYETERPLSEYRLVILGTPVWAGRCASPVRALLKRRGLEERIRSATGLLIDAYFSGSKIRWILDNVPGVRRRAERGEVLFGTVESWLIWKLTGRHVTDYANASRTMLFDIHRLAWDEELCGILGVPTAMLPQPVPNSAVYGTCLLYTSPSPRD